MTLENALPVVEFAWRVVVFPYPAAVEKAHGRNSLRDGMTIRARVAVDRRAGGTGDAGHGFKPFQSRVHGEIDESLQRRAGLDVRGLALPRDAIVRELENHAAKTGVGDDQIRSTTNDDGVEPACARDLPREDEAIGIARFRQEVGRATDPESGVFRKAGVAENGGFGQRGEFLERLLNDDSSL